MPPDGKDEASGSPLMSSLPLSSMMTVPSPCGLMKESCFSAVVPVSGWNQWVKCVAPFSMAHSFMAQAVASATTGSSSSPVIMLRFRLLYTSLDRRARISFSPKT